MSVRRFVRQSGCMGRFIAMLREAHANVAVLFALALVPIVVAGGGAVDYAMAQNVRGALQDAMDSSVLAGAGAGNATATAAALFRVQTASIHATIDTPTFVANDDGSLTGRVDAAVPTGFLGLIGVSSFPVSVSATATRASSANKVCILLTNPSTGGALVLNGGANISAPDCEVDIKSTGYNAATFNSGTSLITAKTCIASSTTLDNGGTHPNLEKSCTTASDPYAGKLPIPAVGTCDHTWLNVNGGTVTLNPGVYCGINFNGAPHVTFNPGLYVIRGGNWGMNGGSYTGDGVTFYFADSSQMVFNSSITVKFTAPNSGSYDGILMFEPQGLGQGWWNFNTGQYSLSGLIYTPSRSVTFNGGASGTGTKLTWVANTMMINSVSWSITPGAKAVSGSGGSGSGGAYLVR